MQVKPLSPDAAPPPIDDDPVQTPIGELVAELFRLVAAQRDVARAAMPAVTPQTLLTLGRLRRHGPQRMTALAEAMAVDVSVASRQVAALVDAGYVTRTADPTDGRAQLLSVTEAGQSAWQQAYRQMVAHVGEQLAGWDEPRLRKTSATLREIRELLA